MKTVLVAEDSEMNRHVLATLLKRKGYEVVEAENGAEALALLESARPDLVLLDLMMPEVDGVEVLRALRQRPGDGGKLPVVVFTALAQHPWVEECRKLGADACLLKGSVTLDDLVGTINSVVA